MWLSFKVSWMTSASQGESELFSRDGEEQIETRAVIS